MPRKNLVKQYRPNTGYHVYSRGFEREAVFRDQADYAEFMSRLRRLLLGQGTGRAGRPVRPAVRLSAYALVPNHFHLYLSQASDPQAIRRFMYALTPAYARYFSSRHGLTGVRPVWEGTYRARPVHRAAARIDLISYIHLNRDRDARSEFTSHPNYLGERTDSWLDHRSGLRAFGGNDGYRRFIDDNERIRATRRAARRLEW